MGDFYVGLPSLEYMALRKLSAVFCVKKERFLKKLDFSENLEIACLSALMADNPKCIAGLYGF